MNETLLNYINSNQLISYMNTTKWKKLINAIENINPEIRYKIVYDNEPDGFSLVWWHEILQILPQIEWLEISPIKKTYIGQLVKDKKIDSSVKIKHILDDKHITYELVQNNFRIYGYKRAT